MDDTAGTSRSTNFTFKKDFVKDSMVVLGPERTFKLRNPLVQSASAHKHGLLQGMEDGIASLRGVSPYHTVPKVNRPIVREIDGSRGARDRVKPVVRQRMPARLHGRYTV